MTTATQTRFTGPDRSVSSRTPHVTFLQTDFTSLTGAKLQQIQAFERSFYTVCPRDFARSVARDLSARADADSETRLEGALREFSKPVIREIVRQIDQGTCDATVAEVFTCGKEVMNSGDAAIGRAKAEFLSRTAGTVAG